MENLTIKFTTKCIGLYSLLKVRGLETKDNSSREAWYKKVKNHWVWCYCRLRRTEHPESLGRWMKRPGCDLENVNTQACKMGLLESRCPWPRRCPCVLGLKVQFREEWLRTGLHNSEISKGQSDQHKFSAGRKCLFHCTLVQKSFWNNNWLYPKPGFCNIAFPQLRKLSRATRKALAGRGPYFVQGWLRKPLPRRVPKYIEI